MNSMFEVGAAFALEIIAAVAATSLVVFAANREDGIKKFGTWIGGLGLAFSILGMACTGYYSIAYWQEGLYSPKAVMANEQTQGMMDSMHKMPRDRKGSAGEESSKAQPVTQSDKATR